jgi:hypothetical protein
MNKSLLMSWAPRALIAGCGLVWVAFDSVAVATPGTAAVSQQNSGMGVVHSYEMTAEDETLKFSITLPEGWQVSKDTGGFRMFAEPSIKAQPTAQNPVVADPNITVSASRNPMPIDELSVEPYAQQIIAGLQRVVGESANLEIFLRKLVDVSDDRKGLLYYVRYKKGSFDVFNAVLVVSSATHLFRVTLTDYETTFDKNLEAIFPFMASIDVGTSSVVRPSLTETLTPWVGAFLALVVVFLGSRLIMHRLAQSQGGDEIGESDEDTRYSVHPMSQPASMASKADGSEYDASFGKSSAASRFGQGAADYTEVPLSQAIAGSSGVAMSGHASVAPGRSVTDPESEFGELSGAPAKSYARQASSVAHGKSRAASQNAPKSEYDKSGFGFSRGPDDDDL